MLNNELFITVKELSFLELAAKQLIEFIKDKKVVIFEAPMGAGKTTLIKEICRSLGSVNKFSSPTYSIVNEYEYPSGKIFHFDLYRIVNIEELLDIGIEDYLSSNQYCFFEWPEKVIDLIDENYVKIKISQEDNIRYIRASIVGI
jgi:tRNA threonylcarbamoyladenosine biosynthesis protein TsaE